MSAPAASAATCGSTTSPARAPARTNARGMACASGDSASATLGSKGATAAGSTAPSRPAPTATRTTISIAWNAAARARAPTTARACATTAGRARRARSSRAPGAAPGTGSAGWAACASATPTLVAPTVSRPSVSTTARRGAILLTTPAPRATASSNDSRRVAARNPTVSGPSRHPSPAQRGTSNTRRHTTCREHACVLTRTLETIAEQRSQTSPLPRRSKTTNRPREGALQHTPRSRRCLTQC
mmetsp:Transcript_25355/g.51588  ORF Transcript_25355/g.51588 Transcript_25355/m.51588 type:complete len:243 (+) Transcript_25355:253-981(+)